MPRAHTHRPHTAARHSLCWQTTSVRSVHRVLRVFVSSSVEDPVPAPRAETPRAEPEKLPDQPKSDQPESQSPPEGAVATEEAPAPAPMTVQWRVSVWACLLTAPAEGGTDVPPAETAVGEVLSEPLPLSRFLSHIRLDVNSSPQVVSDWSPLNAANAAATCLTLSRVATYAASAPPELKCDITLRLVQPTNKPEKLPNGAMPLFNLVTPAARVRPKDALSHVLGLPTDAQYAPPLN